MKCKDCKYFRVIHKSTQRSLCKCDITDLSKTEEQECSLAQDLSYIDELRDRL